MIQFFTQTERFRVERFKKLRDRSWAWVVIGTFNAATSEEARKQGRAALADKTCILRAVPVGKE